jgi:predicted nucleotidyltransferase
MKAEHIQVTQEFIQLMNLYREANKDKSFIQDCSDNPVVFAERMLGIRLYAWQVYFINKILAAITSRNTDRKEFVVMTSRQIGKSTVVAILSLWACVFNKYPGTTMNTTIVGITSASDVQAKKLLYEIKKMIRSGDIHMAQYMDGDKPKFGLKFFSTLLDENEPNNTTMISFKAYKPSYGQYILKDSKSGCIIKSYPPTSSVLGETFCFVIIDEAGKTDKIDDQFFYDFIYPTGNSTNAIRLYVSTPWVPNGFFYRMIDPDNIYGDSPADVCVFTIEAIKLENPEYYETVRRTIEQMNKDGKTDEVQRAYYCRFVKGERSYFLPENIFSIFTKTTPLDSYTGACDLGLDFGGKTTSKTVITISRIDEEGVIHRLYDKVYDVQKDDTIIEDIKELKTRFNIQRMIPDDCPQGDYIIRDMMALGWSVTPMNFRTDKVKKYGAFRGQLKKGNVFSYEDDDLKTEMLAMEFTEGSRQSLIQHAPGYTDDRIDSFVMSCYHFLQDEGSIEVIEWPI